MDLEVNNPYVADPSKPQHYVDTGHHSLGWLFLQSKSNDVKVELASAQNSGDDISFWCVATKCNAKCFFKLSPIRLDTTHHPQLINTITPTQKIRTCQNLSYIIPSWWTPRTQTQTDQTLQNSISAIFLETLKLMQLLQHYSG